MAQRAATLLVGMTAATALSAFSGADDDCCVPDDNAVINHQILWGDPFAADMNVIIETAEEASAAAAALGNAVTVSSSNGDVDFENVQELDAAGSASATLDADAVDWATVTATTTGNAARADACCYSVDVTSGQHTTDAAALSSTATLTAGRATDTSVNAATVANAYSSAVQNGTISGAVVQTSGSSVTARTDVDADVLDGNTLIGSQAIANSVTTTAFDRGGLNLETTQSSTGDAVVASTDVYAGFGDMVTASSNAVGNNANADQVGEWSGLETTQDNASYVRAETYTTYETVGWDAIGSATAQGNSAFLSVVGADGLVDFTQTNAGGVAAVSVVNAPGGTVGSDGVLASTASAYGNASGARVCSMCGGTLEAFNRQDNFGDVTASATITAGAPVGSVHGAAVAAGNVASFQVQRPR